MGLEKNTGGSRTNGGQAPHGDLSENVSGDVSENVSDGRSSGDISPNVLAELWESNRALPVLSGWQLYVYYLARGLHSIFSLPISSTITVMSIGVSLFLLSGFLLLLTNADAVISRAGNSFELTAYLRPGLSKSEKDKFLSDLKSQPQVLSVQFISKESALTSFREELGSRGSFLDGLEEENPLPDSLNIVLKPLSEGIEGIERSAEEILDKQLVDEVVYGSEWVKKIQSVLRVFRIIGIAVFFIVAAVISFLIANTIKLVIYARRDELSIMKLVGASDSFVKIPFVIGGVIQGCIGAVLALLFLKGAYAVVTYELQDSKMFGFAIPELLFLNTWMVFTVVLVGVAVGAIGSFFAVGKFIDG